jgi:hypothetical protein
MGPAMTFYFVRDRRHHYRFFSSEPLGPLPARFSRTREIWEKAKARVTRLNPRTLLQEQAFERGGRPGGKPLRILHSGRLDERATRMRLFFFLQRQRTRHILILAGEALLVPLTGLAALLPGPNLLFYVLAILMVIQWQALRGIHRILRREYEFVADPLFYEWEEALAARDRERLREVAARLDEAHSLGEIKWGRIFNR